jgi:dTDP-4-dehydrorhamnose 3,5-epimerase
MVEVTDTGFDDVKILTPKRYADDRGWFEEAWSKRDLAAAGIDADFKQDNMSRSEKRGTVRGLHLQAPPFDTGKLIYVAAGAVLDVAVDVRRSSPRYGEHVAIELSAQNGRKLWLPSGFAHGFCTLSDNCIAIYKNTGYYAPDAEHGILWNDPDLAIDWPVEPDRAILSPKDAGLPGFRDLPDLFS